MVLSVSDLLSASSTNTNTTTSNYIGVGFGTAGLGIKCYHVVKMALEYGFTKFDTAEENQYWYNPKAVALALKDHYESINDLIIVDDDTECDLTDIENFKNENCIKSTKASTMKVNNKCTDLRVSTKIPPWELTSVEHIRDNAAKSREELVGFCDDDYNKLIHSRDNLEDKNDKTKKEKFPLDVYYIHAPACWDGWHEKCKNPPKTMKLRDVWLALEGVIYDGSAKRIGLSNVSTKQLLDIIKFVQQRQKKVDKKPDLTKPQPRMPDVLQTYADPIQPAEELRKICEEYNIEFVSYSTLGTQHQYRSNNKSNNNPVLDSPIVINLAKKYQRSTAEVVLSWAIQHNMSVIPRSSQREHIQELARLLPTIDDNDNGENSCVGFLNNDDMNQIDLLKNSA